MNIYIHYYGPIHNIRQAQSNPGPQQRQKNILLFTGTVHRHCSLVLFTGTVHRNCSSALFIGTIHEYCSPTLFIGIVHEYCSPALFTSNVHPEFFWPFFVIIDYRLHVNNKNCLCYYIRNRMIRSTIYPK